MNLLKTILVGLMMTAAPFVAAVASPYDPISAKGETHDVSGWDEAVSVYVPNSGFPASTSYPVVFFYGGFALAPGLAYTDLVSQISSKAEGAVVVTWNAALLSASNGFQKAIDIYTRTLKGDLQSFIDKTFTTRKTKIDTSKIFFSAHSAGNQIVVDMAEKYESSGNVKGLLFIDPVDGTNPPSIPLGGSVNVTIPILAISNELCEQKGTFLFPACCTPNYDNMHFYNAFTKSPRFDIVANYYGHLDLCDETLAGVSHFTHFCSSVSDTTKHPYSAYRNLVSGAVGAFISVFGNGNCAYAPYLTDSTKFNTAATLLSDGTTGKACF
ncbi:hypothetical protein HDU76_007605 [Blyttiomyces sp. JEL0837]|nr:hypothetical protein HDU76_007605 [Blyttiomyces sp. JEL0837]